MNSETVKELVERLTRIESEQKLLSLISCELKRMSAEFVDHSPA